MVKRILIAPDKRLAQTCSPVQSFDRSARRLLGNLTDTLLAQNNPEGAGLASPQIGVLRQVFVLRLRGEVEAFINPRIDRYSKKTNAQVGKQAREDLEGCLSVPNVYAFIERPWEIAVSYRDSDFRPRKRILSGFPAIVFQHEYDHLQGILFTQRALEQGQKLLYE